MMKLVDSYRAIDRTGVAAANREDQAEADRNHERLRRQWQETGYEDLGISFAELPTKDYTLSRTLGDIRNRHRQHIKRTNIVMGICAGIVVATYIIAWIWF